MFKRKIAISQADRDRLKTLPIVAAPDGVSADWNGLIGSGYADFSDNGGDFGPVYVLDVTAKGMKALNSKA